MLAVYIVGNEMPGSICPLNVACSILPLLAHYTAAHISCTATLGAAVICSVSCVRQIAIISTRTKLHLDLYVRPPRVLFRAKNKTNTALLPPSNIPYKLIFFALVSKWVGRANISTMPLRFVTLWA